MLYFLIYISFKEYDLQRLKSLLQSPIYTDGLLYGCLFSVPCMGLYALVRRSMACCLRLYRVQILLAFRPGQGLKGLQSPLWYSSSIPALSWLYRACIAFGGLPGVLVLRSVLVSDSNLIFPVFRRGRRWSFILFGCMVCSDRRKVSDGKKLIKKSVSSVPGSDRSEVPFYFRADSFRLGWSRSPSATIPALIHV